MTLELLPNEVIIHCFQYLNAIDLFNGFDKLNYRLQNLIENIPLCFNFQHVKRITFDKFCNKIVLNPNLKQQIYSLKLSNELDTCGQIKSFLSLFSLNKFCQLRSLTLINVNENEIEMLKLILPSLSNLSYFCDYSMKIDNTTLSAFSLPNLRKLIVGDIFDCSLFTEKTTFFTHLTVAHCPPMVFEKLFKYAPMLKYLNVKRLEEQNWFFGRILDLASVRAVYLTQLNLCIYELELEHIQILLREKPNLKILILSIISQDKDIVDSDRWQKFISLHLPHLYIFKFCFSIKLSCVYSWVCNGPFYEFEGQFQRDFWNKQHHWHTVYQLEESSASIFTIPYNKNEYILTSHTQLNCQNILIDTSKLFDNVTNLTLSLNGISKHCHTPMIFSNIKTLVLKEEHDPKWSDYIVPIIESIRSSKLIMNLFNLQHLDIKRTCTIELPLILLQILKETPHLSSLSIDRIDLISLLTNDELCNYFSKLITKLKIRDYTHWGSNAFNSLEQVWNIFSNIEQLKCYIDSLNDILFVFNRLPKLLNLTVVCDPDSDDDLQLWLQSNISQLNANFFVDTYDNSLNFCINKSI
ncbi:unnamed protein product [Adineta steineri]|uniref:F-box domain-containing protein n=1 Tax=Adineta steineri TaxID=433720 RepID=A0A814LXJ7_9BILA|nr:unnamed protein product [Adineta steineri]CAF3748216.1 unnamed protein product [Adineta steineri]